MKPIHIGLICIFFLYGCVGPAASEKSVLSAKQLKLPGKKGVCFTLRQPGAKKGGTIEKNMPRVKALNASWNYSWGLDIVREQPADIEFVPMIWGAWSKEALRKKLDERVLPNIRAGKIKRLLGFNEPDKRDQSNMSYIRALKLWPALEKLGIPLCSPACANPEGIKDVSAQGVPGTWMKDFMREVDKKGYRVDYIGVHWYGGTNSSAFSR